MQPAPLPDNENERLAVLRRLNILDTAPEAVFDEIVALASQICGTPCSLVSLIDADRQWFKANKGLDVAETPRDVAFCAHAILSGEIMIVEDAHADDRFADNPLVTELPKIRFYAGMPLTIEEDINVGTLCVIDQKPRQLSEEQLSALKVLGRAAIAHIRLARLEQAWTGSEESLAVCAWCRSVRSEIDGTEAWQPLHDYVATAARVSHGMCPVCAKKLAAGSITP